MLIDVRNTYSLTDFHRNSSGHLQRLKETLKPELLTVNGSAAVVVQDAEAYQAMAERLDLLESVERIKQAIKELGAGKGVPIEDVFKRLEARLAAKYPSDV